MSASVTNARKPRCNPTACPQSQDLTVVLPVLRLLKIGGSGLALPCKRRAGAVGQLALAVRDTHHAAHGLGPMVRCLHPPAIRTGTIPTVYTDTAHLTGTDGRAVYIAPPVKCLGASAWSDRGLMMLLMRCDVYNVIRAGGLWACRC